MATLAPRAKDGHLKGILGKEKDALRASKLGRNPIGRYKTRLWASVLGLRFCLGRGTGGRLRRNEDDPRPTPWAEDGCPGFARNLVDPERNAVGV